jgi:hypothetical protein
MSRSTEDVKNWMNMFRWIVKLIRDEFGIDEKILVRTATLETDMGLSIEQVEQVLEYIAESFQVRFPENTLDEIVKLEELCMLASWMKGYISVRNSFPTGSSPSAETSTRLPHRPECAPASESCHGMTNHDIS